MRTSLKIFLVSVLLATTVAGNTYAQRFDRGMDFHDTPVFMPKGNIMFGGTASYRDYKMYDYKLLLLDNMDISAYTLSATPYIYYVFAKNMAVGLRFSYQRTLATIGSVDISLSDDMSFGISDFHLIQHTYYGSLSYRYYIPIAGSKIFGIFSDVSLNFGAGQGKTINGTGDNMTGTYQNILDLGIDVVPGLIVFVSNEMAVEASIGILGLGWKRVTQTTNQIYEGSYETSNANFRLNLLSINIGVNFVLPLIKEKKASGKSVKDSAAREKVSKE